MSPTLASRVVYGLLVHQHPARRQGVEGEGLPGEEGELAKPFEGAGVRRHDARLTLGKGGSKVQRGGGFGDIGGHAVYVVETGKLRLKRVEAAGGDVDGAEVLGAASGREEFVDGSKALDAGVANG